MLRMRVGQIKEMFGAKYLIQSSRKSLSISALQSAAGRYDKIDRDAKMIEIKNENNPTKKKALMRDLLRGYEVKKAPVQNVPNLEQTLLEIEMSKNNFYVKLNLYIYYLINYGSQRNLFGGRVAADFKENPLGDVGIEIGRSHSEIIEFQKNRIFKTYGIEYNEELALKSLGMPFIDFRWEELKKLGIISKEKYESVMEKWESLSNEDLLKFQSNYLAENGLEIEANPAKAQTTPVTSTTKKDSKQPLEATLVYNGISDGNSLDEYKQLLLEFMKDPNQFKLDSMTELYQKGELKNTDCALYLAYKTGTVMRMPFQLNSILSSRPRWENLAKERGIKIDFDFFEVYSTTVAIYDNEIDGFDKKLGMKIPREIHPNYNLDKYGSTVDSINDIHKTEKKISSNQMEALQKERERTISKMRQTQKSRDIVKAKREIIEYTLFQKLLNIPNFVSMESNSNSGLIGLYNQSPNADSNSTRIDLDAIYEKFGCLHANTRLVSGGRHSPHYTGQIARLESQMHRKIEDELYDLNVEQISTPSLFSSFISEVLYGHQNNMSNFSQAASNLPVSSFDSLGSLYSTFVAARMKSQSGIFFNFGEDYSRKSEKYSKTMSLLSLARQGQSTDKQFDKQLEIHRNILDKLNLSYRIVELSPKQMEPSGTFHFRWLA